jgi:transcriptional regulator with XRE-family HTH domain
MLTGEQIRAARAALGESQSAFAERFGVDQSTIHRWETDGPPGRGAARKAIEHVLGDLPAGELREGLPQGERS